MAPMSSDGGWSGLGVDPVVAGLVRLRATQLHGCAHCLDLRTREARARGESEERLYLLGVWQAASCYSGRERAALALCEAVASPFEGHDRLSQFAYRDLRSHFDADAIAALVRLIAQDAMYPVPPPGAPYRSEPATGRPAGFGPAEANVAGA